MEPIIRLKRTCSFDTTPYHWYFHDVKSAKRFAEKDYDYDTDIEWSRGCNEYVGDNKNWLPAGHGGHCYNYSIDTISIEVLDDEDGEV